MTQYLDPVWDEAHAQEEYRANAKVGDIFYIVRSCFSDNFTEVKVVRTTKTTIILENGVKLSRSKGTDINNPTSYSSYIPATPAVITLQKQRLAKKALQDRSIAALAKAEALKNNEEFISKLEHILKEFALSA